MRYHLSQQRLLQRKRVKLTNMYNESPQRNVNKNHTQYRYPISFVIIDRFVRPCAFNTLELQH